MKSHEGENVSTFQMRITASHGVVKPHLYGEAVITIKCPKVAHLPRPDELQKPLTPPPPLQGWSYK